jgi:hypothetical protein
MGRRNLRLEQSYFFFGIGFLSFADFFGGFVLSTVVVFCDGLVAIVLITPFHLVAHCGPQDKSSVTTCRLSHSIDSSGGNSSRNLRVLFSRTKRAPNRRD